MAYIGNQPTDNFVTFATQNFSTSATSSYTLSHAVSNENEIALFINNVRQHPGSGKAYTAAGTALTLSANTASTDVMYCIFLGRAIQSTVPATNSITAAMVSANAVTGAKLNTDVISAQTALASSPADTDELLISDAGVLKRIDVSLVGGKNTPAFQAYASGTMTLQDSTYTTIAFNNDSGNTDSIIGFDEGGCYNDTGSNATLNGLTVPAYSFMPNVAGKYRLSSFFAIDVADNNGTLFLGRILKNGSTSGGVMQFYWMKDPQSETERQGIFMTAIVDADGTDDYYSIQAYCDTGSGTASLFTTNNFAFFMGEKLIT